MHAIDGVEDMQGHFDSGVHPEMLFDLFAA
jgi:hypothetical protein